MHAPECSIAAGPRDRMSRDRGSRRVVAWVANNGTTLSSAHSAVEGVRHLSCRAPRPSATPIVTRQLRGSLGLSVFREIAIRVPTPTFPAASKLLRLSFLDMPEWGSNSFKSRSRPHLRAVTDPPESRWLEGRSDARCTRAPGIPVVTLRAPQIVC